MNATLKFQTWPHVFVFLIVKSLAFMRASGRKILYKIVSATITATTELLKS